MKSIDKYQMKSKCLTASSFLKSIAHPARLKILCLLSEGEKNVSELEEFSGASQSSVSQFLKRMEDKKLLSSRMAGKYRYYKIKDQKIFDLLLALQNIYLS